MSAASPMSLGLYFIDILACLLFCLTLALVDARFGREVTVPVELPQLEKTAAAGTDLLGVEIVVREAPVEALGARLADAPPPAIVVRSEASPVTRVIGAAHAAGVHDIQLAYETPGRES